LDTEIGEYTVIFERLANSNQVQVSYPTAQIHFNHPHVITAQPYDLPRANAGRLLFHSILLATSAEL
jgi:hypothetical protein